MLTFTDDQHDALRQIDEFIDSREQVFELAGIAGTGKSTLLAHLAARWPQALLCAPTGKAASVLRQKTRHDACTIHRLFYRPVDAGTDAETGLPILKFERVHERDALRGCTVLADESSMINDSVGRDLIASGAKIIAAGDLGQLPPVTGSPFFREPDVVLREIHRQALDSPIIRQAHAVKMIGRYSEDGDAFVVADRIDDGELMTTDIVLCWKNSTRHQLNRRKRKLLSFYSKYPETDEQVVCLKNLSAFGVFNGEVYTVTRPFDPSNGTMWLLIDGREVAIPRCAFTEGDGLPNGSYSTAFDFGYCLTVHKSQGSEWPSVLLVDEYAGDDRKLWLYTGVTRARQSLVIARSL
jgi:exodeoxyribonuclease-5